MSLMRTINKSQIKAIEKVKSTNIKNIYSSVDCLQNKLEELEANIKIHKPDIIMISEILPKMLTQR